MSCFCPAPQPNPALLNIPPNLPWITRQTGRFSDHARELRQAIGGVAALDDWTTHAPGDLGQMLIEFWAVLAEVQGFYDSVRANEAYLGTARATNALSDLVALLGHERRPSVSAQALLALEASGVIPVTMPAATAFRSGAVKGGPPQVFESGADITLHPAFSQLDPLPPAPTTLGAALGLSDAALTIPHLYVDPDSLNIRRGAILVAETSTTLAVTRVTDITEVAFDDAPPLSKLTFDPALNILPDTAPEDVSLWRMTSRVKPWQAAAVFGDPAAYPAAGGLMILETLLPQIAAGDLVTVADGTTQAVARVTATSQVRMTLTAATSLTVDDSEGDPITIPVPAVTTQVTQLDLPGHNRLAGALGTVTLGYGAQVAGKLISPPVTKLIASGGEILPLANGRAVRHALPDVAVQSRTVLMADRFGAGQSLTAEIDPAAGTLKLGQFDGALDLAHPARARGNVVTVTRGETVIDEVLGFGNAAVAFQTFPLANGPLTYLEAANEAGIAPQITVRVDGQAIARVDSLFGAPPDQLIYRLRDVAGDTPVVVFGDGIWGARLRTGAEITATYRHGAGQAAPEAGSITQLVAPAPAITAIDQPFAAYGGSNAEPPEALRSSAPASAMLLGRVVSLADFQTAAAQHPGVTGAQARWAWSPRKQRPLVQVYVAPEAALVAGVAARLRALSDPSVALNVMAASPMGLRLVLNVTIDAAYRKDEVMAALRTALTGPGARLDDAQPQIGTALFPSVLVAEAMAVTGISRVDLITLDGAALPQTGLAVAEGTWATIAADRGGALILNGEDGTA